MSSILRSPARAAFTRPILKRPAALPMSPRVQVASFSVLLSPTNMQQQGLKSPHVHFPSPSQLAATITTYSPTSYDRAPISISPNPLDLPGWGERVYSPSIEGFRLTAPPKVFKSLSSMAYQPSPVITDFEDPRSPKLQPAADVKKVAANTIRFTNMTTLEGPARPGRSLEASLPAYPRSPYPSAPAFESPLSPSDADTEMDTRGRQLSRGRTPDDNVSGPARARARARSVEERVNKRNKKGLTLGGRPSAPSTFTPIPSPLAQTFSPAAVMHTSTLNRANKPAPLALTVDADSAGSDQLSNAFWNSVSMDAPASSAAELDSPMVTALEYPESATEYEEKHDMTLRSASQPPLMFANSDGSPSYPVNAPSYPLFSPGLPKPRAAIDKVRSSLHAALMSPGVKRTSFNGLVRKDVTAPSPNDPFAAFPSFGAALQMEGAIQYPPRVVLERV